MAFCTKCGAALPDQADYCSSCGAPASGSGSAPSAEADLPRGKILKPNVAAMLAYFTFIPAVLLLFLEPYSKDRFVRFHAFQSLFFNIAWFVLDVLLGSSFPGALVPAFMRTAISFAVLVLWIVLVVQAYRNTKFQLPLIGPIAEGQANR